jgi:Beta propeller domain
MTSTLRSPPTFALLAGALLSFFACSTGTQKSEGALPIQSQAALERATSCSALDSAVQEAAVRQMRAQLDAYKQYPYWGPVAADAGATPASAADGSGGPVAYTTTNTQVAGVDEGDFFKNDGTRILVLQGSWLHTAKSWPPEQLAIAGRLQIEGWPQQLLLDGDTALVVSTVWTQPANQANALPCPYYSFGAGLVGMPYCGGSAATKITAVDLTTLGAPAVKAAFYLPGWTHQVRKSGTSMRLVLADQVRWPAGVRWWPDWSQDYQSHPELWPAAIAKLEDDNEAIIRRSPAQAWLPPGQQVLQSGAAVDLSYDCTDIYLPNAPELPGLVTVATLDTSDLTRQPTRTSIFGEAGTVYATATRLYLASQHWWGWWVAGQADWTYLHVFDLTDPAKATYLASGGVEGHLLDQFSLDESGGSLRAALTTTTRVEGSGGASWAFKVGNHVAVLQQDGPRLSVVGDTGLLVADESIRAARFVGDSGFVVTFRGYDPLITVDLSYPGAPKKVAELTVPGFSTYLEPIDAGHLLAVGVDLPEPDPKTGAVDWSRRAVQLSLFDIGDLAHPKRTANLPIGGIWAWTEAMYDHHAFNWFPQRGLLAVPFSDWTQLGGAPWYGQFVSDLRVFSVDPAAATISGKGALSFDDVLAGSGQWTYWYEPWVRRSVMATDDQGWDWVYAVSDAGIRVARLSDLGHPVATALFAQ